MATSDLTPCFLGCMLGGAVGDALGAAVEFTKLADIHARYGANGIAEFDRIYGRVGAITDDTQMSMFTAEGLIRAAAAQSGGKRYDPLQSVHHGYLRWLHSQGQRSEHPDFDDVIDGWLIRIPTLHSQRAPGNTCLHALMAPIPGTCEQPINDSKGCGAVMRVAPIGLWGKHPFELGCRASALTHGHRSGWLAGGILAVIIAKITTGLEISVAVQRTLDELRPQLNDEVSLAMMRAIDAAALGSPSPHNVENLGAGWVADEALSISLYCALVAEDFEHGVRLAVNHSGDSDSTGSITGNILGAAWGIDAIPARWREQVELSDEIAEVARDLVVAHRGGLPDPARYPVFATPLER